MVIAMGVEQQFFDEKYNESAILLNEVQRQAVVHTSGPLLLLASPGSGKTTTIIMKIGYLLEVKGVPSNRIKALTFSKAAAADMQRRFKQLFPELTPASFSTIHSFAFEVTRMYLRKQGIAFHIIEGAAEALNDGEGTEVITSHQASNAGIASERMPFSVEGALHAIPHKKLILRQLYSRFSREALSEEQMDELTTYISYIKNKLIPQEQWSQVSCDVPHAAELLGQYEQFKQSAYDKLLLLDFDDMLIIANKALQEDERLRKQLQQRYDYVLTDESQDTSLVQHHIIAQLVESHRNLCVVADDDQSIYSWRGAEPAYLLNFKGVYPEAVVLYMEQNYRSTATIVNTAAQFITRNKQRYPKTMFTSNEDGSPIQFRTVSNAAAQSNYVVERLSKTDNWGDNAVLYRNNASSIPLMNALERAGVPFYVKDGDLRFFSHWVVEDILNFMRMSYTDKRVDLLERIHLKLNSYISKAQMAVLKGIQNDQSVFDNLLNFVQLQSYQVELIESNKLVFQEMKGMPPLPAIKVIRERLGYEKALGKICDRLGFRKDYIIGIVNTLEEIAAELESMEQFASRLKHLHQTLKQASRRRGNNVVTLSTLHSAKGLEFERVYMIDLLDGVLPSKHDSKQDELEEATRLFYVGITRAKRHLELITYSERGGEKAAESSFMTAVRDIVEPPQQQGHRQNGLNSRDVATYIVRQPTVRSASSDKSLVKQSKSTKYVVKQATQYAKQQLDKPRPPKHPNSIASRDQLRVQQKVKHLTFGEGTITELTEDRIAIQFATESKRLALAPCLDNGLLVAVKE